MSGTNNLDKVLYDAERVMRNPMLRRIGHWVKRVLLGRQAGYGNQYGGGSNIPAGQDPYGITTGNGPAYGNGYGNRPNNMLNGNRPNNMPNNMLNNGLLSCCFGNSGVMGPSSGQPTHPGQQQQQHFSAPAPQPAYQYNQQPSYPPQLPPLPTPGSYAQAAYQAPAPVPAPAAPAPAMPSAPPVYQPVAPTPTAGDGTDPSPTELSNLALAGQKLWSLDDNRLQSGVDYVIDVGDGKKSYETHDAAAGRLFATVSQNVWHKPTFRLLYALRDNYHAATGMEESEGAQERQEISDFLDAVLATRPMRYAHKYLAAKQLVPASPQEFKNVLRQMWFSLYRRETQNDSCGFEHVFLGEIDNGEVSGFHNWVQFWVEESKGNIDYRGYMRPRNRGERVDASDRVLACQFTWQGKLKNVTTLFIGTSPEFELALYTLYFLAGSERNNITIDGYELCIRCYAIRSQYGDKVGSSFPELMAETDDAHQ